MYQLNSIPVVEMRSGLSNPTEALYLIVLPNLNTLRFQFSLSIRIGNFREIYLCGQLTNFSVRVR